MKNEKIEILLEIFKNKFGIRLLRQILCVFLIILEIDESIIRKNLGTDPKTIKKYTTLIKSNNMAEIFKDNVYRQKSEMDNFTEEIMLALEKTPPKTLREAAVIIEKTTGLKRSTNQVSNYLKKTALKD